ncbi:MAG: HNH endonuclease [Bacteroidetes bacterium]|nr:HNH endonuclease [Bacteroidota bacterium]
MSVKKIAELTNTTIPTIAGWLVKYNIKKGGSESRKKKVEIECNFCGKILERTPSSIHKHNYCSIECKNNAIKEDGTLWGTSKKKKIKCAFCNKNIYRKPSEIKRTKRQFCNKMCRGKWQTKNLSGKNSPMFDGGTSRKNCLMCGNEYTYFRNKNNKYCSLKCAAKSKQNRVQLVCDYCGEDIEKTQSHYDWSIKNGCTHFFCDQECRKKYHVGKGHPCYREDRNQIKDIVHNLRTSERMNQWRKYIFKRDSYTCQMCGTKNNKTIVLNAHHIIKLIDSFIANNIEKIFDVSNGITLCENCHKSIRYKEEEYENHFQFMVGLKDYTKEKFEKQLDKIIEENV